MTRPGLPFLALRIYCIPLLLGSVLAVTSCDEPKLSNQGKPSTESTGAATVDTSASPPAEGQGVTSDDAPTDIAPSIYPKTVTLENTLGKKLEGTILGKKDQQLAFRRTADAQVFLVGFANLSVDSQLDLAAFPDGEIHLVDNLVSKTQPTQGATDQQRTRRPLGQDYSEDYDSSLAAAIAADRCLIIFFLGETTIDEEELLLETGTSLSPFAESKSLYATVIKSSTYRDFADENFETVIIDLMKKEQLDPGILEKREELASQYGVNNFPVTVIVDPKSTGHGFTSLTGFDKKGPTLFVRRLNEKLGKNKYLVD